jgi:hypothetical protein
MGANAWALNYNKGSAFQSTHVGKARANEELHKCTKDNANNFYGWNLPKSNTTSINLTYSPFKTNTTAKGMNSPYFKNVHHFADNGS